MNVFKAIKTWWDELTADYHQSAVERREIALEKESCASIQVMEFNGKLYIAYNDMPIVRVERLKEMEATSTTTIANVLTESRKDLILWQKKFNHLYAKA